MATAYRLDTPALFASRWDATGFRADALNAALAAREGAGWRFFRRTPGNRTEHAWEYERTGAGAPDGPVMVLTGGDARALGALMAEIIDVAALDAAMMAGA